MRPQTNAFITSVNQKRKELATTVTTPRFYALVGLANLFGFLVSHFTGMNIGKMMAAINATLYLTNSCLQSAKTSAR